MKRLPSSHSLASKLLMGGISGLAVLLTLANPGSAQVVTDVYSFKQAQVAQGPQFVTPTQGRTPAPFQPTLPTGRREACPPLPRK